MTLATRNPNRVLLKKQQDMVEQLRTGTLPTKPIPTIYQNDCLFNDSANQAGDRKAPSPGLRVNSQQNGNNEACEGFLPCSTRMGPTFGTHGSDLARRNPSELWCGQTTGIIEFSNAQRLHAKAMRNLNCKETEIARGRVLNMNKEVNEKLQRKISEASTLAHRLRQHSDALNAETERLAESRNHVASVLQNLVRPLRKCDRRKAVRTKRPERENIEDAVELAIQQERQELQHATQLLTEHISKTDRQIEVMRKVHSNMEQDIQDKLAAISVDKECLTLMKTSGETAVKMQTTAISASLSKSMPLPSGEAVASPRSKNMNNSGGNLAALMNLNTVKSNRLPTQWKDSSNIFIVQSKDLVNESLDLRTTGLSLCKRVKESQQSSCTFVEESLKKKLLVTSSLQSKLSKQRLQLGQELDRLMEQRDAVNQELSDISGPLEIVSRRLELRRTRPAREQVRDAVEEALETEYNSLKKTTQKLQLKLDKLNREIAAIQMSQKEVASDLEDKSRALELDQECLETASTSTSVSLPPMNRSNSSRSSTRSSRRRP